MGAAVALVACVEPFVNREAGFLCEFLLAHTTDNRGLGDSMRLFVNHELHPGGKACLAGATHKALRIGVRPFVGSEVLSTAEGFGTQRAGEGLLARVGHHVAVEAPPVTEHFLANAAGECLVVHSLGKSHGDFMVGVLLAGLAGMTISVNLCLLVVAGTFTCVA